MPRHHLVPQMLLRRFADADQRLVMVSRDKLHEAKLIKVRTACAEVGFYAIPTDDVAASHQAGHDPEGVEKLLSQVEGDTAPVFADMIQGRFPPTDEQRFRVSLFVALQISRGWRFRHDVNALATLTARLHLPALVTDERIRRYLRSRGKVSNREAVEEFRHQVLADDAFTVQMSQPFAVQQALRFAVETLQPLLYFRTWRLLRFEQPLLLTSDNPVGLWSPALDGQQPSHGLGTARAIFLPLDRQTALAMVQSGSDTVSTPGAVRARAINLAVASGAERWVFHHPSDEPLKLLRLPPRAEFVDETVRVTRAGEEVRELHRLTKRTDLPPNS